MKSKPSKRASSFSLKQILSLIIFGYIGMPIILAIPLLIYSRLGFSLAEHIGLGQDNFYLFILASSAVSSIFCGVVITRKLRSAEMPWSSLGFRRVSVKRSLKYILALPIVIIVVTLILAILLSHIGVDTSEKNTSQADFGPLWVSVLVTVIFAPVIEEILFRGLLLKQLLLRLKTPMAIILGGVIFALAHLDPVRMIMVLPLGLYLGYTYYRLQSIWPGICIHAGWNLLVVLATTSR